MKNKGFSLVELIVVIAIMAILVGVAVPVYSSYVEKAQKASDIQMVDEIKHALQVYYASNPTDFEGGYVVLTTSGAHASTSLNQAMETFGGNWASELSLSYQGWFFDKSLFSSMVSANGNYISSVPESSYINGVGTESLLNDVQQASSKLAEFLAGATTLVGVSGKDALNVILGGDANNNYLSVLDDYSGNDITAQVLADATVFGIAATLNDTESSKVIDKFSNGYYVERFSSDRLNAEDSDVLTDLAHTYAALEAFVGYVNANANANANVWIEGDVNKINEAFNALRTEMSGSNMTRKEAVVDTFNKYGRQIYGASRQGILDAYKQGQGLVDGQAYIGIMQTVNGLSDSYKNSLGADGLFTSQGLANQVDSFVAAAGESADLSVVAAAKSDILNIVGDGSALVIVFSVNADGIPGCTVMFMDENET